MVAERLKLLRKRNNVKQTDVSPMLGVTTRNYQRYEAGEIEPNIDSLIALADYFGVSLDYLVGRSDNPNMNNERT